MQSVSSRIWTCIAVFISYDDNQYTTGTSTSSFIWFRWEYDAAKHDISKFLEELIES